MNSSMLASVVNGAMDYMYKNSAFAEALLVLQSATGERLGGCFTADFVDSVASTVCLGRTWRASTLFVRSPIKVWMGTHSFIIDSKTYTKVSQFGLMFVRDSASSTLASSTLL